MQKSSNLHIYGIVYGDKTTPFTPYKVKPTDKPWRFENEAMIEITNTVYPEIELSDYIGVVSHRFTEKTGLTNIRLYELFNESQQYEKPDVYNCSPQFGNNIAGKGWNFMQWSEQGHKGITKLIKACCEHCGITYTENPPHVFWANQFIATNLVYAKYIDHCILPSLELLEGELWEQSNKPSGYVSGLEASELKNWTGLDFYNFVPFVLERMAMQYFHRHKLNIRRLV